MATPSITPMNPVCLSSKLMNKSHAWRHDLLGLMTAINNTNVSLLYASTYTGINHILEFRLTRCLRHSVDSLTNLYSFEIKGIYHVTVHSFLTLKEGLHLYLQFHWHSSRKPLHKTLSHGIRTFSFSNNTSEFPNSDYHFYSFRLPKCSRKLHPIETLCQLKNSHLACLLSLSVWSRWYRTISTFLRLSLGF